MSLLLDVWTVVTVSAGIVFFVAGTVGLLRFPDTLTRLHALTKRTILAWGLSSLACCRASAVRWLLSS
jgi:multicomponent Na+:H+ antiporter subunit G